MGKRIQPLRKTLTKRSVGHNRNIIIILLICASISCGDYIISEEIIHNKASSQMINVYNTETEKLMQLEMETYIAGVVAAEMPASFELDALKAQAVAARTFALKRMNVPNSNVKALHSDAQISTSPTTCQAWISDDEQRERWGKDYIKWHQKLYKQ
jgi:peptidoglycan hydrolase-like amidase